MKTIWLSLALFLAAVAPALALQVTATFPPANSESFTTADTIRVVFDGAPPVINDNNVLIQGRNGSYGVDRCEIQGWSAFIHPRNYWIVGDEVRVVISSQIVDSPYYFSFTIHVPYSDWDPLSGRHILRYDSAIPMDIAGTDVDGDGKVDLAILFTDSLGVVRNNVEGAERFDPQVLTWTDGGHPACDARRSLRAADMSHDGLPELVITDPIRNLLTVYHNTSAGGVISFADTTQVALQLVHPTDVQLADLNGDGNVDIAVIGQGYTTGQIMVLLNMGVSGGRFTFAPYTFTTGLTPTGLAVTDVNLTDHLPELLVACFGSQSVEMFTVRLLPSFGLQRSPSPVVSGLASGPDGLIVNNVAPYWDNLGGQQLPDIFLWSQGLHAQAVMNRGRRALDEEPYLWRVRNRGNGEFEPESLLTGLPGQFQITAATVGTLDSDTSSPPDQNWVVVGRSLPNGNWQIYRSSDDLDNWTEFSDPGTLQSPYLPLLFDLDEDGDLDYFFIDHQPGAEKIVYYYRTQVHTNPADVNFPLWPINGTRDSIRFYYPNLTPYPQIVDSVGVCDTVFDARTDSSLPHTLDVGDSLGIWYTFRPPDSIPYFCPSRILMTSMTDTVTLFGTGGRSDIRVHDAQDRDLAGVTLWFGCFSPCSSNAGRTTSIHLHNLDNYPLTAKYITDNLDSFRFCPPMSRDSVAAYDSTLERPICFTAPCDTTDRMYTECFEVYDSTFAGADSFGPRNILIADTVRVCLKARVLNNDLPEDSCPTLQLREGDSGTIFIPVYDPDDSPHQPVWCKYDETSPTAPLTVTPRNPGWDTVSQCTLDYVVDDNVDPPGETCILRFELKDNQYPDSTVTRACTLWIANVNDLPVITVLEDPVVVQETALVDRVLATVTDEENDNMGGDADWIQIPSGHPDPPLPQWYFPAGICSLYWPTDCDDEGNYVAKLRVWDQYAQADTDTVWATVSVHVDDTPPDLAVENLRTEPGVDTVNRRTAVTVKFDVRETRSICPVSDSFQVQLWHDSGAGLTKTLISRWETSLPAGNTLHFQYGPLELEACSTHTFRAVILCTRPDSLASNNTATIEVFVRCPDLWAESLTCPSVVHKWNPYSLSATIQETTGIPVDSEFCVTITDNGHEFWRRCFPGLQGRGTIQVDSICPEPTGALGEHILCLHVFPPPGQDVNASNNDTCCSMLVVGDPFHAHPLPFTPNGDGYNDTLYFDFGDEKYENGPVVCIFDLAGRLIVELDQVSNKAIPWNGRDRHDAECVPGPYFYTFTNGDQKVSSGLVYVAR